MPTRQHLLATIVKLILYYFMYQLGLSAAAMAISYLLIPMDMATMTSLAMVASTIVMTWHLTHFGYVRITRHMYKEVSLPILGVSALFIFAAMYVLNLLIEQAGIPNTMEETFLAMSRNSLGLLSIALLAPILEELLFRGAIQGSLQAAGTNPWSAIIISATIFGVVHMNPAQIPFAFLLGLMFGWLYYRTGSLFPGIVGHVLNNSVAAVNMLLYGDTPLEEQLASPLSMWLWAAVATAVFCLAAAWLNKNIKK